MSTQVAEMPARQSLERCRQWDGPSRGSASHGGASVASKSSSYVALVEGLAAVEIALPELRMTSVAQLMSRGFESATASPFSVAISHDNSCPISSSGGL